MSFRSTHRQIAVMIGAGLSLSVASAQIIPTPAFLNAPSNTPSSVADLVESVSPAVVNIVVRSETGETTSEGQGSGFIISPIGEVVTNYHVIEGGSSIDVVFKDGTEFPARIIGTDEETDLALLKIDSTQPFPDVKFYKGNPIRVGDWVVAIGNPFGIGQSTSVGIISAIGRDRVESGAYVDYIQTDATINRGNSGGPLFNPQGAVIGVNSAIFSPTGASVGIAFAIPHQTAENVIESLRRDGRVRRGWLGVGLRTAEYSSGDVRAGAHVNNIVQGGPAHLNGLQVDDVILQINGRSVSNAVEATRVIGQIKPGTPVSFLIERNERQQSLTFAMAERPEKSLVDQSMDGSPIPPGASTLNYAERPSGIAPRVTSIYDLGISAVDLSSSFRERIGMRYDQVGIYVDGVVPGSPAANRGLRSNVVILEADDQPVPSVHEFRDMVARAQLNNRSSILLLVRSSDGQENFVSINI